MKGEYLFLNFVLQITANIVSTNLALSIGVLFGAFMAFTALKSSNK